MAAIKVNTRNQAANEINVPSFSSHLWSWNFYVFMILIMDKRLKSNIKITAFMTFWEFLYFELPRISSNFKGNSVSTWNFPWRSPRANFLSNMSSFAGGPHLERNYRIYSNKRRPRISAAFGTKKVNKRRPRISAAVPYTVWHYIFAGV